MDEKSQAAATLLGELAARWGAPFVPRSKFREFSVGLFSPAYLANLDSRGQGPKNAFMLGGQRCYPVDEAVGWLRGRLREAK